MGILRHSQDYPPRSLPPTIMSQRFESPSTSPNEFLFLDLQENKSKFLILGHSPTKPLTSADRIFFHIACSLRSLPPYGRLRSAHWKKTTPSIRELAESLPNIFTSLVSLPVWVMSNDHRPMSEFYPPLLSAYRHFRLVQPGRKSIHLRDYDKSV